MSPSSPIPPVSIAGTSPLVERIARDLDHVEVRPAFGTELHVVLHGTSGMPEAAHDAVAAVTIHGSGYVEYHLSPAAAPEEPVAYQLAEEPQLLSEVDVLRARLAAVEALIQLAAEKGITTIDRALVARAAESGER